jgi:hypothetical protein
MLALAYEGCSGKIDATYVWPHAQQADVEAHAIELARVCLSGLIELESAIARGHFMDSVRVESERRRKQVKRLLRVPVGMISGYETFVAPPKLDTRPVHGGVRPSSASFW